MSRRSVLVLAVASSAAHASGGPPHIIRVERTPEQVYVAGGTFTMGVDATRRDELLSECEAAHHLQLDPQPDITYCNFYYARELVHMAPREVYVSPFFMDRTEVSVADYRRCVAAGGCGLDPLVAGDGRYIQATWPIVNVTWFEARVYCAWKHERLPTEAEWERAASSGTGQIWPWGNAARPRDWNHGQALDAAVRAIDRAPGLAELMGQGDDSDGALVLAPPGSYVWGETGGGIRDLAGNVAEWTADAWRLDNRSRGYQDLNDGTRNSPLDLDDVTNWHFIASFNPIREGDTFDRRVVRGGSWRQPQFVGKSYARDPYNQDYDPSRRFAHVGFRCVRDL